MHQKQKKKTRKAAKSIQLTPPPPKKQKRGHMTVCDVTSAKGVAYVLNQRLKFKYIQTAVKIYDLEKILCKYLEYTGKLGG